MTVPGIPAPTPEARKAWPQTPVQEFTGVPLPDLAAACEEAQAAGNARLAAAGPVLDSAAGYGADGFSIAEGSTHGWPADMTPPDYQTPLHPGPHGG